MKGWKKTQATKTRQALLGCFCPTFQFFSVKNHLKRLKKSDLSIGFPFGRLLNPRFWGEICWEGCRLTSTSIFFRFSSWGFVIFHHFKKTCHGRVGSWRLSILKIASMCLPPPPGMYFGSRFVGSAESSNPWGFLRDSGEVIVFLWVFFGQILGE